MNEVDHVNTQLAELRKLQAEADARTRAEANERKRVQEEKLDRLIKLQADQAAEQERRQAIWNKVIVGLGTVLTAVTGGGAIAVTRQPTVDENVERAMPVIEKVEANAERQTDVVDQRMAKAEQKIQVLGGLAVEQQIQISDGFEFIADKLDAAHPNVAGEVAEPPSVTAAKRKTAKLKRDSESKRLFDTGQDPFEALAK